jgi:hypothetical protein
MTMKYAAFIASAAVTAAIAAAHSFHTLAFMIPPEWL